MLIFSGYPVLPEKKWKIYAPCLDLHSAYRSADSMNEKSVYRASYSIALVAFFPVFAFG